ncbi:unnamed protein product [Agarophyton chilense]|eukprot:gb/GEZJ01000512.1/.p1 GENE.gb/GEZJ01000512.1/~~gb/GEZJ01000512.1/.p1  ORF type:complete len:346 (-),score=64.39 gb/GEZJ01000512.1/:959-1996(-)
MKLAFFSWLLAYVVLARAGFNVDNLNDGSLTRRQVEGSSCPRKIEFNTNKNEIGAGDIQMEDKDCKGNGIITVRTLGASAPNTSSAAVKYFSGRNEDVGGFLAGTIEGGNIECEAYSLKEGEELIFLKPDDDVEDVEWENVFGGATPLSRDDDDDFELDDNDRFLIISNRCFYSETELLDRVCFPADAEVRMHGGSLRRMDQLSIGDHVQTSQESFSSVFAWTHADAHTKYRFVQLDTKSRSISLTASHYIYADGVTMAAGKVKVGMKLLLSDGSFESVTNKKTVWKTGLYNPQTLDGDIVVNGVVATTYTTAIELKTAHALLAPVRAAFSVLKNAMGISAKASL